MNHFRHQGDGSERVHADRLGSRHRPPRHDVCLSPLPPKPETPTIGAPDAAEPRPLPHLRVHRRTFRHELVHGFRECSRFPGIDLIPIILGSIL